MNFWNYRKEAYGVSIVTPPWRLKISVAVLKILSRMMISVPAQSLVPSGTFKLIISFYFGGRLIGSLEQRREKVLVEVRGVSIEIASRAAGEG